MAFPRGYVVWRGLLTSPMKLGSETVLRIRFQQRVVTCAAGLDESGATFQLLPDERLESCRAQRALKLGIEPDGCQFLRVHALRDQLAITAPAGSRILIDLSITGSGTSSGSNVPSAVLA